MRAGVCAWACVRGRVSTCVARGMLQGGARSQLGRLHELQMTRTIYSGWKYVCFSEFCFKQLFSPSLCMNTVTFSQKSETN